MKKIFPLCFLAASLLVSSPFAAALDDSIQPLDNDPTKICLPLTDIQKLVIKKVEPAQGKDRYNVSTDNQYLYGPEPSYKYLSYTFHVFGVKAVDALDAAKKVQDAISAAANQHPTAIRLEPDTYYFNCVYSLDFSNSGDEYNGVYPTATLQIQGTDTQNLYSTNNMNITK